MPDFDTSGVSPKVVAVAERAKKAGWEAEWVERGPGLPPFLRLSVPNGREVRSTIVSEARAARLLDFQFEEYRVLGIYMAIDHPGSGYIEALIQVVGRFRIPSIKDIPGAELVDENEALFPVVSKGLAGGSGREVIISDRSSQTNQNWRIKVGDDRLSWSLEISPMTDRYLGLITSRSTPDRRRPTLKLFGIDAPRHDDAVRKLEDIAGAFLFDLDIRYGLSYELTQKTSNLSREYEAEPIGQAPTLPRNHYPTQALSLYSYGRSASGMPLLQFLAYYQVLEFFFPMHSQREALRKLRQMIIDPRFEVDDDGNLARILQMANAGGRSGYGSEREQLKATISGCVDSSGLLALIHSDPEFFESLGDKKAIKDVPIVDENNRGTPFLDQVVSRVYALRNRVVHAKADGGDMAVELLLPGSMEARAMAADIALVQFLAQKAIIAGGASIQ